MEKTPRVKPTDALMKKYKKFKKPLRSTKIDKKKELQTIKISDKQILGMAKHLGILPFESEVTDSYFTGKGFVIIYKPKESS